MPRRVHTTARNVILAAAVALLAAVAPSATAATSSVDTAPGVVHLGQAATLSFTTSAKNARCTPSVRYANGAAQAGLRPKVARNHRVSWTFTVPTNAAPGQGRWRVACGRSTLSGTFVVLASATPTQAPPKSETPRVVVDKQGFSQRPDSYGTGSSVSYGLMLHNTSATSDADKVYFVVNFVDGVGRLLGSSTHTIDAIGAGSTFAWGDAMSLRTQLPVARLEVTVRVGAHEPKKDRPTPLLNNVRLLGSDFDPGWVGEVDGEVVNDRQGVTLTNASYSVVVFDAAGSIVGGGTGLTYTEVPAGTRLVFLAQTGFRAIPLDRAVSTVISITSSYRVGG